MGALRVLAALAHHPREDVKAFATTIRIDDNDWDLMVGPMLGCGAGATFARTGRRRAIDALVKMVMSGGKDGAVAERGAAADGARRRLLESKHSRVYFGDRAMTVGASEPNVLLDLTAGALRTVAESIVGALYVLAERRGVLGPSKARRRAPPQLLAPGDRVRAKTKRS